MREEAARRRDGPDPGEQRKERGPEREALGGAARPPDGQEPEPGGGRDDGEDGCDDAHARKDARRRGEVDPIRTGARGGGAAGATGVATCASTKLSADRLHPEVSVRTAGLLRNFSCAVIQMAWGRWF